MRIFLYVLALIVALSLSPVTRALVMHGGQELLDRFDKRPVAQILMIGNSRTYYHDMPFMVRRIADSDHAPQRYEITLKAWGGASFEENWNDSGVQAALKQRWSQVILQSESRASLSPAQVESFDAFGQKLIRAATNGGSPVAVIVNWGYDESIFAGAPAPAYERARHVAALQTDTERLLNKTGASGINTGQVWESVKAERTSLALTDDGNHPTVTGSYLSALMIYAYLSHRSVAQIAYRPDGVDDDSARVLQAAVDRFYRR